MNTDYFSNCELPNERSGYDVRKAKSSSGDKINFCQFPADFHIVGRFERDAMA